MDFEDQVQWRKCFKHSWLAYHNDQTRMCWLSDHTQGSPNSKNILWSPHHHHLLVLLDIFDFGLKVYKNLHFFWRKNNGKTRTLQVTNDFDVKSKLEAVIISAIIFCIRTNVHVIVIIIIIVFTRFFQSFFYMVMINCFIVFQILQSMCNVNNKASSPIFTLQKDNENKTGKPVGLKSAVIPAAPEMKNWSLKNI